MKSIDDDERPGRSTEIGDALSLTIFVMPYKKGVTHPFFHSAFSVPIVRLNVLIFFSVKIACIVDMDMSNNSKISHTVILRSSGVVRRSTVVMRRHF